MPRPQVDDLEPNDWAVISVAIVRNLCAVDKEINIHKDGPALEHYLKLQSRLDKVLTRISSVDPREVYKNEWEG